MVDTSMAPCGTRQDVGWDLVDERCDDPDWVRAEFDALVALTWPDDDHDDSGPAAAGRLAGPNEAVQADSRSGGGEAAPLAAPAGHRRMGAPTLTPVVGHQVRALHRVR
jgi:hypothetical protein